MQPSLFTLGPLHIYAHGVLILAGFLLALQYIKSTARKPCLSEETEIANLILTKHICRAVWPALGCAVLGARLVFVLLNAQEYSRHSSTIYCLADGGLSSWGAALFGGIYLVLYCHRHHLSLAVFADRCAPGLALVYAFGRMGCLVSGCCYGAPCTLPWAVRFLKNGHSGQWTPPSHPTQLYAVFLNLLWFALLHHWSSRPHRTGEIALSYGILYCLYRVFDDVFRANFTSTLFIAGLTYGQIFSLLALPILLVFLCAIKAIPSVPQVTLSNSPHSAP